MKTLRSPSSFARLGLLAGALALSLGVQAEKLQSTGGKGNTNYLNNFDSGDTFSPGWTGATEMKVSTDGGATYGSPFWAYCIDPKTSTSFSTTTYTADTLHNFLTIDQSNGLTGYEQEFGNGGGSGDNGAYVSLDYKLQNASAVETKLTSLFSHAYEDSLTSNIKAAAFGYVVWEIMGDAEVGGTYAARGDRDDGSPSTAAGTNGSALRSIGAVNNGYDGLDTQIDAYLKALNTNTWTSVNSVDLSAATNYVYTVYFDLDPHKSQNFIRVTEGSSDGPSVPEPGSLALAGLAMAAVVGRRRIRGTTGTR